MNIDELIEDYKTEVKDIRKILLSKKRNHDLEWIAIYEHEYNLKIKLIKSFITDLENLKK